MLILLLNQLSSHIFLASNSLSLGAVEFHCKSTCHVAVIWVNRLFPPDPPGCNFTKLKMDLLSGRQFWAADDKQQLNHLVSNLVDLFGPTKTRTIFWASSPNTARWSFVRVKFLTNDWTLLYWAITNTLAPPFSYYSYYCLLITIYFYFYYFIFLLYLIFLRGRSFLRYVHLIHSTLWISK